MKSDMITKITYEEIYRRYAKGSGNTMTFNNFVNAMIHLATIMFPQYKYKSPFNSNPSSPPKNTPSKPKTTTPNKTPIENDQNDTDGGNGASDSTNVESDQPTTPVIDDVKEDDDPAPSADTDLGENLMK